MSKAYPVVFASLSTPHKFLGGSRAAPQKGPAHLIFCAVKIASVPTAYRRIQGTYPRVCALAYNAHIPTHRGRLLEASTRWSGERRPRAGFALPLPGGPGCAVRRHYDRLPDGCTWRGRRAAKAAWIRRAQVLHRRPEAWLPGTEKPRWSAERRAAYVTGRARLDAVKLAHTAQARL